MTCCFDQVVDAVDLLPGAVQVQAALHDLDAEVVLLVDHQADLVSLGSMATPRAPCAFGQFAADQLPLDEELAVDAFQLVDVDIQSAR